MKINAGRLFRILVGLLVGLLVGFLLTYGILHIPVILRGK
jgi:hypothetical protein